MNVLGVVVNHERRSKMVFTTNMLVNQVRREAPKIGESFDRLCSQELESMSELCSQVWFYLYSGFSEAVANDDELRMASGELLLNALNTFVAAVELLRSGYWLQAGILIRNVVETISTVLCLFSNPDDLDAFRSGVLLPPFWDNQATK
jgi:hypothetical protein